MKMSIEMKMQGLDKMIEMRKQLVVMQDNLGVFNGFGKDDGILIYSTEEFLEIANHVNTNVVSEALEKENYTRLSFDYNGTVFHTFILPHEHEAYKSEIDLGGGENV
jgi:hypothetical protein